MLHFTVSALGTMKGTWVELYSDSNPMGYFSNVDSRMPDPRKHFMNIVCSLIQNYLFHVVALIIVKNIGLGLRQVSGLMSQLYFAILGS